MGVISLNVYLHYAHQNHCVLLVRMKIPSKELTPLHLSADFLMWGMRESILRTNTPILLRKDNGIRVHPDGWNGKLNEKSSKKMTK